MNRQTVLITGASAGIGLELARLFAADGCDLALVARRLDRLDELAEELRSKHSVRVDTIASDLTLAEAPQRLFDEVAQRGLTIDVVVNNAGFGLRGKVAEIDLQRQLDMVRLNALSVLHLTRLFLPGMIERRSGGILNVASTAAFQPGPNMAVYFATKAFVLSLTDALVEELRGTGVSVTCLAPGPTVTEFAKAAEMEDARLFNMGAMSAVAVARAGYRGFRRGKALVVPGLGNKLLAVGTRFMPRWLVRKIAGGLSKSPGSEK
jgi:short-subunit dehydrogenase